MFDPTAFDNMKVVIEGLIYDKDLDGEYEIIDRNDYINLSKMDRLFSIQYRKLNIRSKSKTTSCRFSMKTTASDLYNELIKGNTEVGCFIEIEFFFPKTLEIEIIQRSLLLFQNKTAEQYIPCYNIKQSIFDKNIIESSVNIKFQNKMTEEDFDLVEELVHISEIMLQWYDEQILKEI
ncbi:hypothetical protein [Bacillus sp. AFS041924]|uniref:hypothetical protein n=1 Tax=Bacillus sp. AFS041924 TaxID=2033503 RepID=UPI000BFDEBDA|nr:hypothetical protein [Bacillus sp. AFS041924]PGS47001.1 hypothetical protein COC46_20385 [Bacillus sp. AFS041924]